MSAKITKVRLKQLIDQVREETKKDLAKSIEEAIGPDASFTLDEFAGEVIPKLLATTFTISGFHAEYLIQDVLTELDLLTDDD